MLRGKSDKDPEGLLVKAEDLIAKSPGNVLAHHMLADAASAIGMSKTAVFAPRNDQANPTQGCKKP